VKNTIRFKVLANPEQKGSKKAFPMKGKDGKTRCILAPANPAFKVFEKAIRSIIAIMKLSPSPLFTGAVSVKLKFYLKRPKSTKRPYPSVSPDLDKYCRTVLDALTGWIYKDDGQVVVLVATKEYVQKNNAIGVEIEVKHIEEIEKGDLLL